MRICLKVVHPSFPIFWFWRKGRWRRIQWPGVVRDFSGLAAGRIDEDIRRLGVRSEEESFGFALKLFPFEGEAVGLE